MKELRTAALLLVAAGYAAGTAHAQVGSMMTMGLRGGVNQAFVSATIDGSSVDPASRTAYHVSGLLGLSFSPNIAMMLEIQYVGKGFEETDSATQTTLNLDLKYLNLPLTAVYTLPLGNGLVSPRLYAGPALGYRVSCNLDSNRAPETYYTDCDADTSREVDFSIYVGAGVKIGRGYGGLTLDVSYDHGLSNFNKSSDAVLNNRNLLVSVGFLAAII